MTQRAPVHDMTEEGAARLAAVCTAFAATYERTTKAIEAAETDLRNALVHLQAAIERRSEP